MILSANVVRYYLAFACQQIHKYIFHDSRRLLLESMITTETRTKLESTATYALLGSDVRDMDHIYDLRS